MIIKIRINRPLVDVNELEVYPPCEECGEVINPTMSIYTKHIHTPALIICRACLQDFADLLVEEGK